MGDPQSDSRIRQIGDDILTVVVENTFAVETAADEESEGVQVEVLVRGSGIDGIVVADRREVATSVSDFLNSENGGLDALLELGRVFGVATSTWRRGPGTLSNSRAEE